MPTRLELAPGETSIIHSGIRWCPDDSYQDTVLLIVPRSSMVLRRGLVFPNPVAVIDFDYQFSDNEGEIILAVKNDSNETVVLERGERIAQGIVTCYFKEDEVQETRNGGIGSTGRS